MEKANEMLEKNPYFSKYADKIAKLQKTSPEEFLSRLETTSGQQQKVADEKRLKKQFSSISSQAKPDITKGVLSQTPQKKLDSIMKTELLKDKTKEEIEYLWREFFREIDAISGSAPVEVYNKLYSNGLKYPLFLFPIPRDQGYEFIVSQFAGHEIHFTPLINYQAYKENAPECLTMVHFPDLQDEHGIVLMHGEYNNKVISAQEAQFLANQVQLYYMGDDQNKLNLLETFHNKPDKFHHMELVEALEKLDLEVLAKKPEKAVSK